MMSMPTPTARDVIHGEAVNLVTDLAALLLDARDQVPLDEAYNLSMECLEISQKVREARHAMLPAERSTLLQQARTAAMRTMVGLERFSAYGKLPADREGELYRRLSNLAGALGALADPQY